MSAGSWETPNAGGLLLPVFGPPVPATYEPTHTTPRSRALLPFHSMHTGPESVAGLRACSGCTP